MELSSYLLCLDLLSSCTSIFFFQFWLFCPLFTKIFLPDLSSAEASKGDFWKDHFAPWWRKNEGGESGEHKQKQAGAQTPLTQAQMRYGGADGDEGS